MFHIQFVFYLCCGFVKFKSIVLTFKFCLKFSLIYGAIPNWRIYLILVDPSLQDWAILEFPNKLFIFKLSVYSDEKDWFFFTITSTCIISAFLATSDWLNEMLLLLIVKLWFFEVTNDCFLKLAKFAVCVFYIMKP